MANLQAFYLSNECDIYFNKQLSIIQSRWKGVYVEGQRFYDILDQLILALDEYGCSTIIADAREMFVISEKDRRWTIDSWYPRAVKAGFRNQGLILSKGTFSELSVKQITSNYDEQTITTKYFLSPSEALDWVREISNSEV